MVNGKIEGSEDGLCVFVIALLPGGDQREERPLSFTRIEMEQVKMKKKGNYLTADMLCNLSL